VKEICCAFNKDIMEALILIDLLQKKEKGWINKKKASI
jgi:hypothetical protein